jgi:hypothetical protein
MDQIRKVILITVSITNGEIIIGLIGNVLSFLVFSRKAFAKSSINIYCRALAIFDCFMIAYTVFTVGTQYVTTYSVNKYSIACKIMYFFTTTLSPISGWIVVAFSIDQAICVANTQKFQFTKKRSFQIGVCIFLAVFHLCIYIATPILLELKNVTIVIYGYSITTPACSLTTLDNVQAFLLIYLFESNFVPFAIMILTTVYIIRELRKSSNRLATSFSSNILNSQTAMVSKKTKQKKYALNSVALSLLFIALTSPVVFEMMFQSGDYIYDTYAYRICTIFFYMNYSSHFFTHFIVNSVFRREFLMMIGFRSFAGNVSGVTSTNRL